VLIQTGPGSDFDAVAEGVGAAGRLSRSGAEPVLAYVVKDVLDRLPLAVGHGSADVLDL
jgi:hypothetical protein